MILCFTITAGAVAGFCFQRVWRVVAFGCEDPETLPASLPDTLSTEDITVGPGRPRRPGLNTGQTQV